MIRDDRLRALEPEHRDLGEHFPFVGNARAEHVIERRDAIGGDDQQLVAEVVNIADLALTFGLPRGQRRLKNGCGKGQHDVPAGKIRILQGTPRAGNNNI